MSRFLNVVFVNGMPKVFNHLGEEIPVVTDLIIKSSEGAINVLQLEAPCNVYNSIEEMKFNVRIREHLMTITEDSIRITLERISKPTVNKG